MSRSRKKSGCGCGSDSHDVIDPIDNSRSRQFGRRRVLFPTDIKSLLIVLADNEDDERSRATLILDACSNHCLIEDARIVAVTDNTVIIREGNGCDGDFRFVCIGCICEVCVECDALMEGIFEERTNRR